MRVLLTDHPWPDTDLERQIIEGAGFELLVGPIVAPPAGDVVAAVADGQPDAIMTCWAQVNAAAIAAAQNLKVVARMGVGLDNIAVDAATRRGAWVTNVPDYCTAEVADHAVALMLSSLRGVVRQNQETKAKGWGPPSDGPAPRLSEVTVGIVGYGRIGRETARRLAPFGCRILATRRSGTIADPGVEAASMADVEANADVIILHAPLTAETQKLVDAAMLDRCRRRPLLINVSRGGLVDNEALMAALDAGKLRGAALDVIDGEPAPPAALVYRDDVIVTPHTAYLSDGSLAELRRRACEDVVRVLRGETPQQPCNEPAPQCEGQVLPGGVSSDIRMVEGPNGRMVVKRALAKLNVADDWFSDPARSLVEAHALQVAAGLMGPDHVPHVLWVKPEDNTFAMTVVDERLRNWKAELLAGRVDPATGLAVGTLLGRFHAASAADPDLPQTFADLTYFRELRVEPFFDRVAAKLPEAAAAILAAGQGMQARRTALVHGDYSPKNIMADGADVVILDFEVAHWGDPRFDLGFCLSHLLLKAARPQADAAAIRACALAVLDGYAGSGAPTIDDPALARITACLMLARTDGPSPVDYLGQLPVPEIRQDAIAILHAADPSIRGIIQEWRL